jgi:hypothetical protein
VEYYFYRDSDGSWTVDLNHWAMNQCEDAAFITIR